MRVKAREGGDLHAIWHIPSLIYPRRSKRHLSLHHGSENGAVVRCKLLQDSDYGWAMRNRSFEDMEKPSGVVPPVLIQ